MGCFVCQVHTKTSSTCTTIKSMGLVTFFNAFEQSLWLRVLPRQLCCLYYYSFVNFYQFNASLLNKILKKKKILLTPDFQIAFERLLSSFAQYARYIYIVLIHPNQSNQTVCKLWATSKGEFSSTVLMMLWYDLNQHETTFTIHFPSKLWYISDRVKQNIQYSTGNWLDPEEWTFHSIMEPVITFWWKIMKTNISV